MLGEVVEDELLVLAAAGRLGGLPGLLAGRLDRQGDAVLAGHVHDGGGDVLQDRLDAGGLGLAELAHGLGHGVSGGRGLVLGHLLLQRFDLLGQAVVLLRLIEEPPDRLVQGGLDRVGDLVGRHGLFSHLHALRYGVAGKLLHYRSALHSAIHRQRWSITDRVIED